MSKTYIVVLQYNNSEKTKQCLASLQRLRYLNAHLVIIDNGSREEEREAIEEYIEKHNLVCHFIAHKENRGFSGGMNPGIRYALKNNADYVMLLNNDTLVPPDILEKMIDTAENDRHIGIVGPIIDEGNHKTYGGAIQWLKPELKHLAQPSITYEPDFLTGACWLVGREVLKEIGLLDEDYFLYFEDVDYCMRVKKQGYTLALAHNVLISHAVSSTTKKYWDRNAIFRLHYRNALLFNRRYGPWWVKIILPFWAGYTILKQILKLILMPWKYKTSFGITAGVFDYYRGKFGAIR
jgi:GT2 family glycosyltransferase